MSKSTTVLVGIALALVVGAFLGRAFGYFSDINVYEAIVFATFVLGALLPKP